MLREVYIFEDFFFLFFEINLFDLEGSNLELSKVPYEIKIESNILNKGIAAAFIITA